MLLVAVVLPLAWDPSMFNQFPGADHCVASVQLRTSDVVLEKLRRIIAMYPDVEIVAENKVRRGGAA